MAVRIASTSLASIGHGVLPEPIIKTTPGVDKIGTRSTGANRQNKYPEKSGSCRIFTRSDHRRLDQYRGRKSSKPLWRRASATAHSQRDLTRMANQESCDDCELD